MHKPSNIIVEINKESPKWDNLTDINEKFFTKLIKETLSEFNNFNDEKIEISLSVLLCDSNKMTLLNNQFRGKNKDTNILSFPDMEISYKDLINFTPDKEFFLGDIALSYDKIIQEATENKINLIDHIKHLTIHSILHLIGFDHINNQDTQIMQNLEIKILSKINIDNPYKNNL